jgi:hypothetical protein
MRHWGRTAVVFAYKKLIFNAFFAFKEWDPVLLNLT